MTDEEDPPQLLFTNGNRCPLWLALARGKSQNRNTEDRSQKKKTRKGLVFMKKKPLLQEKIKAGAAIGELVNIDEVF